MPTQILVGNKCDIDESKRAVPYSKGQALANEFGIKFFETSAKSNINVEEVRSQKRSLGSSFILAQGCYQSEACNYPCFSTNGHAASTKSCRGFKVPKRSYGSAFSSLHGLCPVPQTFQSIAKEIMVRLSAQQEQGSPARGGGSTVRMDGGYAAAAAKKKAACCST